jgi:hypothetical protein
MSVILATQEAEIRRIKVQSQPGQIANKTLSQHKKKAGRVAQMLSVRPWVQILVLPKKKLKLMHD